MLFEASFLIFDLGVDWRYGAAHFEELLLDYDPCSNWGNWVAAAGLTGQRINKFNTRWVSLGLSLQVPCQEAALGLCGSHVWSDADRLRIPSGST